MPHPESGDPKSTSEEPLTPLRTRIDEIDGQLLILLNQRSKCANAIGHIKKRIGLPIYLPAREQEILHNVTCANQGPLDEYAVRRIFERIIDETRSLERRKFQESDTS